MWWIQCIFMCSLVFSHSYFAPHFFFVAVDVVAGWLVGWFVCWFIVDISCWWTRRACISTAGCFSVNMQILCVGWVGFSLCRCMHKSICKCIDMYIVLRLHFDLDENHASAGCLTGWCIFTSAETARHTVRPRGKFGLAVAVFVCCGTHCTHIMWLIRFDDINIYQNV